MATILVVDDEQPIRWLLRDILEIEGHEVFEAEDGEAALRTIAENQFDLVVLDVMMPPPNGIEVLQRMRETPETQTVPVLMLTAAADDSTTWAGWSAGANYYMTKPFDDHVLLQWLDRLLEAAEAGEESPSGGGLAGDSEGTEERRKGASPF